MDHLFGTFLLALNSATLEPPFAAIYFASFHLVVETHSLAVSERAKRSLRMAQHICSRHRGQRIQKIHCDDPRSQSGCQHGHSQHQHGHHDGMNRRYGHNQCHNHGYDHCDMCRRTSMRHSGSRECRQMHQHRPQCHRYQECRHRCGRRVSDSSDSDSDDSCYDYVWPGGPRAQRNGRSSRRSSRGSKRSKSLFTPMNYGHPGCQDCQQAWGDAYDAGPYQHPSRVQQKYQPLPPPQQGQGQGQPPPEQQQQQQQAQQKPPPPELEELRKNVFKGIKEFSRSLRKQQWYGDMDYVRGTRKKTIEAPRLGTALLRSLKHISTLSVRLKVSVLSSLNGPFQVSRFCLVNEFQLLTYMKICNLTTRLHISSKINNAL
ncbi:hypothetical protein ECG_09281 [Echinococcus granulosus]|uniref:Expressed protein n=1 Tax=Echinococcus granulosus TaxID=6210 RepID=A0A068X0A7_ECHGR|nr:hypothetical protein ECG_09281 [Echinococcus granulosus]CDS23377.1 expressed protein [Echinococcus granulosus]